MSDQIRRTPLHAEHVAAGARIIPFAGFEMPVQYPTGIVAEHRAVRRAAGLFDVSHMGELEIRGEQALELVQRVTTNDASPLEVGQAQYSVICQEDGCALDDCLVYRFADHYMLVVNASTREHDRDWITGFARALDVEVVDRSDEIALLALQGPRAATILSRLTEIPLPDLAYYHFVEGDVAGEPVIVSRTGYTGEDGFELFLAADAAVPLWRALLDAGDEAGLIPAGLGARDALRLEMGYVLYGNDLDDQHTPLEAGLGWVVKLDKTAFLGQQALRRQQETGVRIRLAGFVLEERGFPRQGYEIRSNGAPVGTVTSGLLSPTLDQGIGLGYVPIELSRNGTPLEIMIRDRPHAAQVVKTPFHQGGSIRR